MRFSIPWVSMILVTSSPRILTMVLMVFFISSSSSSIRRCMCGNNGFNRPTVLLSLCYDKFIHVKNLDQSILLFIPTGSSFFYNAVIFQILCKTGFIRFINTDENIYVYTSSHDFSPFFILHPHQEI